MGRIEASQDLLLTIKDLQRTSVVERELRCRSHDELKQCDYVAEVGLLASTTSLPRHQSCLIIVTLWTAIVSTVQHIDLQTTLHGPETLQ